MASINIDIDNTVNDFLEQFLYFVNGMNDNLLHSGKMFNVNDITSYRLQTATGIKDEILQTMFFKNDEFYRHLSPLPDSVRVIKRLVEAGNEVKFVTAINYEAINSRLAFIREHFPFVDVDRSLIVTNDKSTIWADIVIDDYFNNLYNNRNDANCTYILFSQPWNNFAKPSQHTIAYSWKDIEEIMETLNVLPSENGGYYD